MHFFQLQQDDMWSGGEPAHQFTTICIFHAAANMRSEEEGEPFLKTVDDVVHPLFKPKGIVWESNIYETPRFNCRLQAMQPPFFITEMNDRWITDNDFTDEDRQESLHR
ncbi:putative oxalocrotonate tautomerase [Aspergillus granulosus]|uniref:Oxalocrotonate tautomerase n=1 Tax=Aspergillus granulosus TaxID=176169 RepID=A0ABR4HSZ3_9EURO